MGSLFISGYLELSELRKLRTNSCQDIRGKKTSSQTAIPSDLI